MSFINRGVAAYRAGDTAEAVRCLDAALAADARDWQASACLATIRFERGEFGQAYQAAAIAAKVHPSVETLTDLGRVLTGLGEYERALGLFAEAHEMDPTNIAAINNAAMACIAIGNVDLAWDWLTLAEDLDGDGSDVERNKAFVHLMRQNWEQGWRHYDLGVGHGDRVERHKPLPGWLPGMGGPTVIYGEQGIGDEVMFASCIPDALRDMETPVIETMPRLVGLFSRSFPGATVVGSRYENVMLDVRNRVSVAELPGHYRNRQEDFPGKPYLLACSGRRAMVRGLFAPMPRKRKIGIAWTGGTVQTGRFDREADLGALMAAFEGVDAEFVSLEHTIPPGCVPEDLGVHVFPYITDRALDYDYTAALVKELDLVVTVPTAVAHLAGAIGTRCLVLLNDRPAWRCGGPTMPWYDSVEVLRDWTPESVRERIEGVLDGAG